MNWFPSIVFFHENTGKYWTILVYRYCDMDNTGKIGIPVFSFCPVFSGIVNFTILEFQYCHFHKMILLSQQYWNTSICTTILEQKFLPVLSTILVYQYCDRQVYMIHPVYYILCKSKFA